VSDQVPLFVLTSRVQDTVCRRTTAATTATSAGTGGASAPAGGARSSASAASLHQDHALAGGLRGAWVLVLGVVCAFHVGF